MSRLTSANCPVQGLPLRKSDLRSTGNMKLSRGIFVRYSRFLALVLLDAVLLSLARCLAELYGTNWNPAWNAQENYPFLFLVISIEIGFLGAKGLYKSGDRRRDYVGIFKAISLANILLLLAVFLQYPEQLISRSTFLLAWMFSTIFVFAGRFSMDALVHLIRNKGVVRHPVFVFCEPEDTHRVASLLNNEDYYRFAGWEDIGLLERQELPAFLSQIAEMGISEIFVCPRKPILNPMYLYWMLRNAGIRLCFLSIGLDPLFRKSEISTIGGVPYLHFVPPTISGMDFKMKRATDFCFAVLLLLLASPVYLGIALLIKLDSPGPIFYRQTRIGLHSQPFDAWKFRTMVENAAELQKELEAQNQTKDGILFKIKNDPRITRVGRFLRQYSLDELPQVFNVISGEMSFVGPRPLPLRDVEKFSERHFIRHEVLPGITGLWQVSGRSDITDFEDVLRLDIRYIENWSLLLDLKIVFKTIQVILQKAGAY